VITLIGAAVGLMNIMLVSVTERTRDWPDQAVGGRQRNIGSSSSSNPSCQPDRGDIRYNPGDYSREQLLPGAEYGLRIPWQWLIIGIALCSLVGLLAGLYPSLKASRLNPIEALRYE